MIDKQNKNGTQEYKIEWRHWIVRLVNGENLL